METMLVIKEKKETKRTGKEKQRKVGRKRESKGGQRKKQRKFSLGYSFHVYVFAMSKELTAC
jgi:hypothetical protein